MTTFCVRSFSCEMPASVREGVGRVLAVGPGVESVKVGDRILAPPASFTWRERIVVSAGGLSALPADADPRQLAMLAIKRRCRALRNAAERSFWTFADHQPDLGIGNAEQHTVAAGASPYRRSMPMNPPLPPFTVAFALVPNSFRPPLEVPPKHTAPAITAPSSAIQPKHGK